jgi:hypothetical protein
MGLATLVLTQLGQTLLTSRGSPLTIGTSVLSAAIVETLALMAALIRPDD